MFGDVAQVWNFGEVLYHGTREDVLRPIVTGWLRNFHGVPSYDCNAFYDALRDGEIWERDGELLKGTDVILPDADPERRGYLAHAVGLRVWNAQTATWDDVYVYPDLHDLLEATYNYTVDQIPFLIEEFQDGTAWVDEYDRLVRECDVMPFDNMGAHATGLEVWDSTYQMWNEEFYDGGMLLW